MTSQSTGLRAMPAGGCWPGHRQGAGSPPGAPRRVCAAQQLCRPQDKGDDLSMPLLSAGERRRPQVRAVRRHRGQFSESLFQRDSPAGAAQTLRVTDDSRSPCGARGPGVGGWRGGQGRAGSGPGPVPDRPPPPPSSRPRLPSPSLPGFLPPSSFSQRR